VAERSAAVDFARASLILTDEENAGEPQWLRRRSDEPLEPDADNAAEGSGGSDAGLAMSAMRATVHGIMNRINQEPRKPGRELLFHSASFVPAFLIEILL
jgi:hypothetical protein